MPKPCLDDLLVVVPARGGSTGIPGKNIRPLGGLPLIGWCKAALQQAGMNDARCILNTDSQEIADVGIGLGYEVPFLRPSELATPVSSLVDVGLHIFDELEQKYKYLLFLLATQPFRDPAQLRTSFDLFEDPDVDGVMSVYEIERSPSMLFKKDSEGVLNPIGVRAAAEQRQEIEPLLTPSGCFFYLRVDAFLAQKSLYTERARGVVTNKLTSIDIDNELDWQIAEAMITASVIRPPMGNVSS